MDAQLLRRYDLIQDVEALYKEILRNVKDPNWYLHSTFNQYRQIDHLVIQEQFNCYKATTNDVHWMVEKWINQL